MAVAIKVNKGDRYHSLIVIEEAPKRRKQRYFKCICDCGKIGEFRFVQMRSGRTKSCGCYRIKQNKTMPIKHGMNKTSLYSIWHSMKQRCKNKNSRAFKWYGEIGISVCDSWNDFQIFESWAIRNGYSRGLTIDRIDVRGNYEPNNCRWATMKEQSRNRTNNILITYKGETKCLKDWAVKIGLTPTGLSSRLRKYDADVALSMPVQKQYQRFKKLP